jgi:hypothetical protein
VDDDGATALNPEAIEELEAEKDRLEARAAAQVKERAALGMRVSHALEPKRVAQGDATR